MATKPKKVPLAWLSPEDRTLRNYRFLGRLADLQDETGLRLKFGGKWYPRAQMANLDGQDGLEFWMKRTAAGSEQ